MVEHNLGLQAGLDYVTQMLADRVADYHVLKSRLPSFGPVVDQELSRYLLALEHFVQGTVEWYYSPSRCRSIYVRLQGSENSHAGYFRDLDITDRRDLVVPLFKSNVGGTTVIETSDSFDTGSEFGPTTYSFDTFAE